MKSISCHVSSICYCCTRAHYPRIYCELPAVVATPLQISSVRTDQRWWSWPKPRYVLMRVFFSSAAFVHHNDGHILTKGQCICRLRDVKNIKQFLVISLVLGRWTYSTTTSIWNRLLAAKAHLLFLKSIIQCKRVLARHVTSRLHTLFALHGNSYRSSWTNKLRYLSQKVALVDVFVFSCSLRTERLLLQLLL